MLGQANCTFAPNEVASDAGVAGAGVLLSFSTTAFITLFLSTMLIAQEFRSYRRGTPCKASVIRRKLLNGYSDQQIMTGIGIQAVGLAKSSTIVPYHFFLIWMLSLLSMAAHNATLLALVRDFRRDWVLRWLRQALMGANLVLSCTYGIFVLQSRIKGLPATMPIACAWQYTPSPGSAQPVSTSADVVGGAWVATILTVAGNCVVFALATWYLHSRGRERRFFRAIQIGGLALMACSAIGAAIRAFLLSQAFGTPDVRLADQGEKDWSFGQVLGLLLLLLPLVSAVEIYRGEIAVPPPVIDDSTPLVGGGDAEAGKGNMRHSFQPNPFWGSQTSSLK